MTSAPRRPVRELWRRVDRAADGLAADLGLYALSTLFAGFTAAGSTLAPHRAWGTVAVWGYAAATAAAVVQLLLRYARKHPHPARGTGPAARAAVTAATWLAVTLLPLLLQAAARAGGATDRAQEEVLVVEDSARRLLDTGTPYLGRAAIALLPEPLLGYTPYQPGMAVFGLPRALFGSAAWTDARVWFALATAACLLLAAHLLRLPAAAPEHPRQGRAPSYRFTTKKGPFQTTLDRSAGDAGRVAQDSLLVRAVQAATVLPLCALTLATGGDDLPVLALCLLALALAARRRFGWAGVAIGAAAAMKLLAWPVVVVLGAYALIRRHGVRYTAGAVGLPLLAMLPPLLVEPAAFLENVIRFPTGHGLVTSPAASPLLGRLLAEHVPAGRTLALALLALTAVTIAAWLLRHPPRTTATVATLCAVGLLAAIVLMPATRFGYLLYPTALALWTTPLLHVDHELKEVFDGVSPPRRRDQLKSA
ncbi:glycosyltransferase 87 family protein [Catellatospora sp. KI3]|uniref:glycosyltransferase 87 family protein n=1 Tax=Catellatospora sp. KI3 TaxID=3041620 RepID=UPI0024826E6A|nr:glycosyltransferase 87 family protein [Catellatospora sp. KI3]MDI1461695.1 glycosyltransferase 87 family protein [Catellatospora sp. KI3]